MLTMSLRINKAKIALLVLLAAALTAGFFLCRALKAPDGGGSDGDARADGCRIEGTSDIGAFLAGFGWEIDRASCECREVTIPKEFDDVYLRYNTLQQKQGYDLERYRGRQATLYTVGIVNYPTGEAVNANVLVRKGKVIGGDICSARLDGFMHGFAMEQIIQ